MFLQRLPATAPLTMRPESNDDGHAGVWPPSLQRPELAALCARYYPQIRRRVHRLLERDLRRGRPWLASLLSTGDVVHEVFLGVVRDFSDFRGRTEAEFVAYLARLVRNRLIDTVRHHEASRRDQRLVERDVSNVCDTEASPGSQLASDEDAELLHRVLQNLSERDRSLLRGRIEDETSFGALAKQLGYASADSARQMFRRTQAKVLAMVQAAKEERS
jgi:RNA polymerase sigma-70 factor, ECF subfamily